MLQYNCPNHPPQGLLFLMQRMGLTPNYRGYHSIVLAVSISLEDPNCLSNIVKDIYIPIGRIQGQSWKAVERNIRSAAMIAWKTDPELINRLSARPLSHSPTNSEFIAMLYCYTTTFSNQ